MRKREERLEVKGRAGNLELLGGGAGIVVVRHIGYFRTVYVVFEPAATEPTTLFTSFTFVLARPLPKLGGRNDIS